MPLTQITSQLSAQHVGTLFLQLNVQDIGLCVPLAALDTMNTTKHGHGHGTLGGLGGLENQGAIVATVESSSISACSAKSTVSPFMILGTFKILVCGKLGK